MMADHNRTLEQQVYDKLHEAMETADPKHRASMLHDPRYAAGFHSAVSTLVLAARALMGNSVHIDQIYRMVTDVGIELARRTVATRELSTIMGQEWL